MDYRKFLAREEVLVLPWFGGGFVHAKDRRLRIDGGRELLDREGWFEFVIKGRHATVRGRAEAPDLSDLPLVRGHLLGNRLVTDGARAEPLHALEHPLEEGLARAALLRLGVDRRPDRLDGAGRHRAVRSGVEIGDALQDRELTSKLVHATGY